MLSWHVQNFVAIWQPDIELQRNEISVELELRAKIDGEPIICLSYIYLTSVLTWYFTE